MKFLFRVAAGVCLFAGACAAPQAQSPAPAAPPAAAVVEPVGPKPEPPLPPAAPLVQAPPTAGEKAVEEYFAPVVAACQRGEAAACARLARRMNYVTNDREGRRVAAALEKGCAAHVPVACAGQAVTLVHSGVEAGVARGLELLRQTCAADEPFACGQLAEIEIKGEFGVAGKQDEGRRRANAAVLVAGGVRSRPSDTLI